jgi:hypothetical protein
MPTRTIFKKTALLGFLILSIGLLLSIKQTDAQTAAPQFLVTWKTTGSYIPSFYQGKALPTYGSHITASLELISNGKVLNLSGQTIYWYLDDNLIGGGVGVQQVTFSPLGEAPNSFTLRITLPNYNGSYLVHAVRVPMTLPKAVIYAPYPRGQFTQNPVAVKALPYFFNATTASALSFIWSVNGQTGSNSEDPEDAQITLPQGTQSGTNIVVSLSVGNHNDSTIATASNDLIYENQL